MNNIQFAVVATFLSLFVSLLLASLMYAALDNSSFPFAIGICCVFWIIFYGNKISKILDKK